MLTPKPRTLPTPVSYLVTDAGVGQPILGSRYRQAGIEVIGNPALYGPYVDAGHLIVKPEPKPPRRSRNAVHDSGRTEPAA